MKITVYFDSVGKVTDKAVQVFIDGESFWIPKSQAEFMKKDLGNGHFDYKMILPKWLADSKGFLSQNWDGTNKFVYDINN